jgi:hypothetical protein
MTPGSISGIIAVCLLGVALLSLGRVAAEALAHQCE